MTNDQFDFVSTQDLRIGLFVDLDLGWLSHPFAAGRFKISDMQQIEVLRGLGVDRIRYVPALSDAPRSAQDSTPPPSTAGQTAQPSTEQQLRAAQQNSLAVCERRYAQAAQQYRTAMDLLQSTPMEATRVSESLVAGMVGDIRNHGDAALRLLSDPAADKLALHPVNVTVVSLLLGQAMELPEHELQDLGMAALLHDIGKRELPERVRKMVTGISPAERTAYQSHVAHGVLLAQRMGLRPGAIQAIAQHHELADGSGFPQHLRGQTMGKGARILALVNRYDGLCNPGRPVAAMTPHEALAHIYSQQRPAYDNEVLATFIRMVGVYPPGSVVQLNDERMALVVSVNTSRPLKPRVVVHEPNLPPAQALVLDLEQWPQASIRRSLKPSSLSTQALEYLRPRQQICYYMEPAANAASLAASA